MNYTKIAFYFRTRDQFESAQQFGEKLTAIAFDEYGVKARSIFSPELVVVQSHTVKRPAIWNRIPKSKTGKKKYIATIGICSALYKKMLKDHDIEGALIKECGAELVPKVANAPKYKEEDVTRETIRIKSPQHFRKITALLNEEYGHGEWHFRGARKIMKKLREAEAYKALRDASFDYGISQQVQEIAKKGLKIDVVVTKKVDNLKPLLFKIQLMA